jgi:hypothetical protein
MNACKSSLKSVKPKMRECKLRSGVILDGTSKEKRVKKGVGVLIFFFVFRSVGRGKTVPVKMAVVLMCNFHGHFTLL